MLAADNNAYGKVLAQEIRRNGCSNGYAILLSRVFALARLNGVMQIQDNPGIHSRIKVKFLDHEFIIMSTRTPMYTTEGITGHIVTNSRCIGGCLQGTQRATTSAR